MKVIGFFSVRTGVFNSHYRVQLIPVINFDYRRLKLGLAVSLFEAGAIVG